MKQTKFKIKFIAFSLIMLLSVLIVCLLELEHLSAKADSVDKEKSQMSSQVVDESLNLEEINKDSEEVIFEGQGDIIKYLEYVLAEAGTSVQAELYAQKKEYVELLDQTTDKDEANKIQNLIYETERLIGDNNNADLSVLSDNGSTGNYTRIIKSAIAFFNLGNYKLAAELLTHMSENKVEWSDYTPVYGYRIMSSDLTYDLAFGRNIPEETVFSKDGTVNGDDLYYAIHGFEYTTTNDNVISISDRYDYDYDNNYSGIQQAVVNELFKAQEAGELIRFWTRITLDAKNYFRVQNLGKNDNGDWQIKLTNYGDSSDYVVYNDKMCFEGDAKNWTGLKDVTYKILSANGGSTVVTISENVAATHIAFCRVSGTRRYITYANNLSDKKEISQYVKTAYCNNYGAINIVGKNGSTWLVNVKNNFSDGRTLEYNSKMCFEDDAKNWTGLKDLKSIYLNSGESRIISISENVTAGHIAISFKNKNQRNIYYANNLSSDCIMNVKSNIHYTYLNLSVSSKSGSTWKINIYNPTSSSLTVAYNTKMCTKSDAANWTNLKDISYITIPAGQTKQVSIKENGLATSITVSYVKNGRRVISYANGLKKSGSINVMYKQ